MYKFEFKEDSWPDKEQERNFQYQPGLEQKQLECLKHIPIDTCCALDFIDNLTMITLSARGNRVYKYTRKDTQSLDWSKDGSVEIKSPLRLKCIGSNVYVLTIQSQSAFDFHVFDLDSRMNSVLGLSCCWHHP